MQEGKWGRERELTCVEDLLCTKHHDEPITCIFSLDSHGKVMWKDYESLFIYERKMRLREVKPHVQGCIAGVADLG